MAGWAAAQGDVMGCRNSKVLPEPPGDVQLDLVKKVSRTMLVMLLWVTAAAEISLLLCALPPVFLVIGLCTYVLLSF